MNLNCGPDVWVGWLRRRPSELWRPAVRAGSLPECARLLEAEGKKRGIGMRHQIMTRGGFYPRPRPSPEEALSLP